MYKYMPTFVYNTIFDIDYNKLKELNRQYLIFDFDNTILPYGTDIIPDQVMQLFQKLLSEYFKIYIISNNNMERFKRLIPSLNVSGILAKANKPFTKKTILYLEENQVELENCVVIGDQLVTDICFANKLGVESILVKSINRNTEKWYTTVNRLRDKSIIKHIRKIDEEKASLVEVACRK